MSNLQSPHLFPEESNVPFLWDDPQYEADRLRTVESLSLLDTAPEADFDEAVRLAAMICKTPVALITVLDRDRQWFKAKLGVSHEETPRDFAFCNHAIGRSTPLIVSDLREDARFAANPFVTGEPNVRFYAGIPLNAPNGHTIGTLCVLDIEPRELSSEQESALSVLGRQVSIQLNLRGRLKLLEGLIDENQRIREELQNTNERLRELSITDGLTRLKNRGGFEERLDREMEIALQGETPLAILLVDIDYFKSFNDDFGHSTCDEILRTVGRILLKTCRSADLVTRLGGEEFAIVLPDANPATAASLAERLRAAVEAHPWTSRMVTVSVGIATWTPSVTTREGFIESADTALYHAKVAGRNRIHVHGSGAKLFDACA